MLTTTKAKSIAVVATAICLCMVTTLSARATVFLLDKFEVHLNGELLFQDDFNDGVAPPSAPDFLFPVPSGAAYGVRGTISEMNGKAILDPVAHGSVDHSVSGEPIRVVRSRLITPSDDSANRNLGPSDTFKLSGVYDLTNPGHTSEQYRIRLTDRSPSNQDNQDNINLQVQRGADDQVYIRFLRGSFVDNESILIGEVPVDLTGGPDQIRLNLEKTQAGNNEISASYSYMKGGSVLSTHVFEATTPIFHDENYTRADFLAQVRENALAPTLGARLQTGSPASLSQLVSTGASPFELTFDYLFETTTGELEVTINNEIVATLSAPGTLSGVFQTVTFLVDGPLDLTDALLTFTLDGPTGSILLIDNILGVDIVNGDFQTGNLTGWTTAFSGAGAISVANVAPVPLPAAFPLFASVVGLAGVIGWRRRHAVRGGSPRTEPT